MDSDANQSKGSNTMSDFLNSERDGKKPAERFNINEEECRENDKIAREEKQRLIDEGKKKANAEGRASRIDELKRSAQFTTQAVVVALLAKLTKTVFEEVIKWLMEKEHKSKELINHIRKAIHDFIYDFKNNVLLGIDVAITTILTQLFGKIIPMIKKALVFVSIGGKSVFEVSKYLKSPENANKDTYTKMMEVGEIFITGLTAASGVALGMGITYVLTKYAPPLAAFQIPLLGSAASLMGIFFGGLTAGICGAIIMAIIEGRLSGKMLNENAIAQIDKTEDILRLQSIQFENYENSVNVAASSAASNITSDFKETRNRLEEIRNKKNEPIESDNEEKFNDLSNLIAKLDV